MLELLSNSNANRARASFARRLTLSVALSAVVCASVFAQSAAKPTTTPSAAQVKPGDAQVKTGETQEKPAAMGTAEKPPASEITRARRAVAPAVEAKSDETAKGEEAELDKLRAEIKDAKAGAERARLQRTLVDQLVELKRDADALAELRLMLHEDRFDPPFFFNTGNALARLGEAGAAEEAYRKAIGQRRGNYARALNNLGVVLTRQGRWDEARETLAAALTQESYRYAEASYNLGRLHLLRGEVDLAIREWHRTLYLEPTHGEAALALARAYVEDGDSKRGLAVLNNFVARSTRGGANVPREIVQARRELGEATDTAHVKPGDGAGGGLRLSPANSSASARAVDRATYDLLQKARERREQGNYAEAAKYYHSVLARSPGGYFPPANLELGTALLNLQRKEEALAVLLPLTRKDATRYPVAYFHLGRIYEGLGQLQLAAQNFARAAELYGDANPQMLLDLSRVREKTGDHAGALAAMDAYIKSIARQGTVPPWAIERQTKLSEKISANKMTQSLTAKP